MKEYEIGVKVRYKGFKIGSGWKWEFGGEGVVVAQTETGLKLKTGLLSRVWVGKSVCEEVSEYNILK